MGVRRKTHKRVLSELSGQTLGGRADLTSTRAGVMLLRDGHKTVHLSIRPGPIGWAFAVSGAGQPACFVADCAACAARYVRNSTHSCLAAAGMFGSSRMRIACSTVGGNTRGAIGGRPASCSVT